MMEEIPISRLPDKMIKQMTDRLHSYSTILIKMYVDRQRRSVLQQIGSGTYIRAGDIYGILTAQHVVAELVGEFILGLTAAPESEHHRFAIERNSIKIIEIAQPVSEEEGPDLGFITLADWDDISTISASKAFHNPLTDRSMMLTSPPAIESSLWFGCGCPAERSRVEGPYGNFQQVLAYQHYCGAGGPNRTYEQADHDYLEMDIDPDEKGIFPANFGGMSGGGVWQVTLSRLEDGRLVPNRYLLSGVIFYQGLRNNETRFIKSHGRRSIYRHALDAIIGQ